MTGTGTDIGKTYVTALLVRELREAGISASYYKAAASGSFSFEESDAGYVKEKAGLTEPENRMLSYLYQTAVSPHLASRLEGNPVEWETIREAVNDLKERYELLIMEGSGGVVCPIRYDEEEKIFLTDIIREFADTTLLIADAGLGTINSIVTTISYMKQQGISCLGILLNHYEGGEMQEDNLCMAEELTGIPVLGVVHPKAESIHWLKTDVRALAEVGL